MAGRGRRTCGSLRLLHNAQYWAILRRIAPLLLIGLGAYLIWRYAPGSIPGPPPA